MAKIFLSAGHGGSDPGAVAYGMIEKNINLNIMLACKDVLTRHGLNVVCSRTIDENDPVRSEVLEANYSKADIAVSFHTNAGGGDGSETYYYTSSNKGKQLAELCEKHVKAIGQNSRGIKSGNHLYFVKRTIMPAVLCECAFIDNDNDNNIIDTTDKQKAFGVAYAKAILEYFGIAYIENNKPNNSESYYPKYTGNSRAIDEILKVIGVESKYRGNYRNRKVLAQANGIVNYIGSEVQNLRLIALAKTGKLKRV